ncbi:hypothetical protein BC832DRAFT_583897 [Gaertneriomyces semiglobifer]|nr:hypothetical protein BC832DRAFT_583897 [Gaertneriomyces semiglobifer]
MVATSVELAPVARGGASLILTWNIAGRNVLVVGGNDIAAQRVFFALEADSYVTVVAPEDQLSAALKARAHRGEIQWFNRHIEERDLDGKSIVLIAAEDHVECRRVAHLAKQRRIPVNVAEAPELSDFWFTSTHRDHAIQIAVSSNGNGPKIASKIRQLVANALPTNAGLAVQRLAVLRQKLREVDPAAAARRQKFVTQISETWPFDKLAELTNEEMESIVKRYLAGAAEVRPTKLARGTLKFIEASIDVEQLTKAAYSAIGSADVVVADADVSDEVLALVSGQLVVLPEGTTQGEVFSHLDDMTESVHEGRHVVRLVAADAITFGEAAVEIAYIRESGQSVQVLTGASPVFNLLASGGVQLSGNVTLIRAQSDNYPVYAPGATLVLALTSDRIRHVVKTLSDAGYPAACGASFLQGHEVLNATLESIILAIKKADICGSGLLVVKGNGAAVKHQHVTNAVDHNSQLEKKISSVVAIRKPHSAALLGTLKLVSGYTAAAHVAYGLSDISFVYPVGTSAYRGDDIFRWCTQGVVNAHGQSHKVVSMSTRAGAASAIHGALSTGANISAILSSEALPLMVPSMYGIARSGKPAVFHVAAQKIDHAFTVSHDYSDVVSVAHTGFGLLSSTSVQEAHDMAIVAHIAASLSNSPIVHFFDGARTAQETSKIQVLEYSEVKDLLPKSADGHMNLYDAVATAMTTLGEACGRQYKPLEYTGPKDAELVVVAMGPSVHLAQEAIIKTGIKAGILNIRLYRPWNPQELVRQLPKNVKRIAVIDQTRGLLFLDITSAFYTGHWEGRIPQVVTGQFQTGVQSFSVEAVGDFISAAENGKVSRQHAITASSGNDDDTSANVHQAIFWDVQNAGTRVVAEKALARLEAGLAGHYETLQSVTVHEDVHLEPISATHVRYGTEKTALASLVKNADYVGVHSLEVFQRVNVARSVKRGGSLVVNTGLSQADLEKEIPASVRSELSRRNVKVLAVDADGIAKNFTLFKGPTKDYINNILSAVFFKLAKGIDFGGVMKTFGAEIVHGQADRSIVYTTLGAVKRGLESIREMHLTTTDEVSEELPTVLSGSIGSKKLEVKEPEESTVRHVAKYHEICWPVIFPETYQLKKHLRPDVEDAYLVKVTENRRVTPENYDRNVFHMEMDIKGTGLNYAIGEALGVHGHNDLEDVSQFLKNYGANPHSIVYVTREKADGTSVSEARTVEQMFTQVLDVFGKPGRKFYQELLNYAKGSEHEQIHDLLSDADAMQKFTDEETPSYADLLEIFPSARPSIDALMDMIPEIKPRHYSISSAQSMHPDSVHLLVVLVDWKTKGGKAKYGQCTRYLSRASVGQTLTVTIKPSVMKLPASHQQPVIMSGLGTGMAPFRAFIEERAFQKSKGIKVGPMVLYFGSRYRAMEYLYGEEMEAYHLDGVLTHLRLAFSRDQKQKIYIQHKIEEDRELLKEYMIDQEGAFYLCGPTWPVPDVRDALLSSFELGVGSRDRAAELLEELKEEERYVLEVY